jgi:hypothetical protein
MFASWTYKMLQTSNIIMNEEFYYTYAFRWLTVEMLDS